MRFDYYMPSRLLFGAGKLQELHTHKLPGIKALIVMTGGKSLRANGYLAALESELEPVEGDEILFAAYPIDFDIQFYLSAAGTVDSFDYRPRKREVYIESISATLEGLQFYPARIDDVAEPFVLPGHLTFKSIYNRPRVYLHLPFDEPQCALDNQLMEKALVMNGYTMPGVEYFPSYFCGVQSADSDALDYPYVIYEIETDSFGNMIDFSELAAKGTECSKLLSNVLLHARFRPVCR